MSGCSGIVDVQPFTKATSDMGAAIDMSLKQVVEDLGKTTTIRTLTEKQQKKLSNSQQQLREGTEKFTVVAHAFNMYAEALEKAAEKGKKHDEKITAVFKATDELVKASQDFAVPLKTFSVPLQTALDALKILAGTVNSYRTNNQLKALASPEQEKLIQTTAKALSAGLADYAQIDAAAYNLLLDNNVRHTQVEDYYRNIQKQRESVLFILSKLTEAENLLMTAPTNTALLSNGKAGLATCGKDDKCGPIDEIRVIGADADARIYTAYQAFKRSPNPDTNARLFAALRQRQPFYQAIIDNPFPQTVYAAEQARWNSSYTLPRQQSLVQFQKSRKLVDTWATSHHDLRRLLLKAGNVSSQDLAAQAKIIQQLIQELQDAKEAAAKEAAEAADKAKEAKGDVAATDPK
ncbi:hypothetical protein GCM10022408_13170 [Hymenobacter fastidiosus]|uniref:Uncharacterized protein n=2 Tax=Hymenobacter fastidiosus TaxID=486264 RepID=A0ABP7RVY2_9BACT